MRFRPKHERCLPNPLIVTNGKLPAQQVTNHSLNLLHRRTRYPPRNLADQCEQFRRRQICGQLIRPAQSGNECREVDLKILRSQ